jgi:integrase
MHPDLPSIFEEHRSFIAEKLGRAVEQEWYVFPEGNRKGVSNPLQPIGSVKTAWTNCRDRVAKEIPDFKPRWHDLRHTCYSKLLATPSLSDGTIELIMGHISKEMRQRYGHIRSEQTRKALSTVKLELVGS